MTKLTRAILIDPFKCEVSEVEYDASDFTNIYKLISHESMPVSCFTVVHLEDGDAIFVDDEGLLKPCSRFFEWDGYSQPLAGRGLIVGSNSHGNAVSAKIALDEARQHVTHLEHVPPFGFVKTRTPWEKPDDE